MPAHRNHPNSDRRLSNLDREWIVSAPSIYQWEMYVLPIPLVDAELRFTPGLILAVWC